jgi:hypothetical protein
MTYGNHSPQVDSYGVPVHALLAADGQIVDADLLSVDNEIGGHHQADPGSKEDRIGG